MTKSDIYIILVVIFLALSINFKINSKGSAQILVIKKSGNNIFSLDLPDERIIEVKNGDKSWILEVNDRSVRVIKSDCQKKICENQGWITENYQSIICAPLKLQVQLKGKKSKNFVDAITR